MYYGLAILTLTILIHGSPTKVQEKDVRGDSGLS